MTPAFAHTSERDIQRSRAGSNSHHLIASITAPRGQMIPKADCACGGGCPRCESNLPIQAKLAVSEPGDMYEQEADRVADQIVRMPAPHESHRADFAKAPGSIVQRKCDACDENEELVQKKKAAGQPGAADQSGNAPQMVHETLRSPGQRLDSETRAFMEPRFGHDFSDVRVHTDAQAAASAREIGALAFTAGGDIVFGDGQFTPASSNGRRLLAHELAHVVQQTSGDSGAAPRHVIQRAPTISIRDEHAQGKAAKTERQAEKSCPIKCCGKTLGTLHAMPIMIVKGPGYPAVSSGDLSANGISIALHFMSAGKVKIPPPGDALCHCDDFQIIQVIKTTHSSIPTRGDSYIDNQPAMGDEPGASTPFYWGLTRRGEHKIPNYLPNEKELVKTTESIYDTPHRQPNQLGARSLVWRGEACVVCINNNRTPTILGCVTYGFSRQYNEALRGFHEVVVVSPSCLDGPTMHFIETLGNDKTTYLYGFNTPPEPNRCVP